MLVLTDRRRVEAAGGQLVRTVACAVEAGADAVVLRERDLPRAERRRVAEEVGAVTRRAGASLLVASDASLAAEVGADGLHLTAADPPTPVWHGRSCHGAAELERAAATGAGYATLSPVAPTASKPGYGPALGVARTASLAATSPVPVVALGGVDAVLAAQLRDAGLSHVAVMGAVMGASDPGRVVRDLVAAVGA